MNLIRFAYFEDRVLGRLHYKQESGIWSSCWTIERPWLENKPNVSCIPKGTYKMIRVNSPKFGYNMWEIAGVQGRSHILIHIANTAKDILGCVGLGSGLYGDLAGVANSRKAITAFYKATENMADAELTIMHGALMGTNYN